MTTPPLPEQTELHRDRMWRRDEDLGIESAVDARQHKAWRVRDLIKTHSM